MAKTRVGMIDVEGSNNFISSTTQALLMLERTKFRRFHGYLGKVREGNFSGMFAWETPPTYQVGQLTWTADITWYASTIAHDTYHSYLYHLAGYRNANIPDNAWKGAGAEQKCNQFQLDVLQELNANASLVTYLQGIMQSGLNYWSGQRTW